MVLLGKDTAAVRCTRGWCKPLREGYLCHWSGKGAARRDLRECALPVSDIYTYVAHSLALENIPAPFYGMRILRVLSSTIYLYLLTHWCTFFSGFCESSTAASCRLCTPSSESFSCSSFVTLCAVLPCLRCPMPFDVRPFPAQRLVTQKWICSSLLCVGRKRGGGALLFASRARKKQHTLHSSQYNNSSSCTSLLETLGERLIHSR